MSPFCLNISNLSSCSLAFNRKEAILELLLSTSGDAPAGVEDPGDNGGEAVNSCFGLWTAEMFASNVWKELVVGYRLTDGGKNGGPPLW